MKIQPINPNYTNRLNLRTFKNSKSSSDSVNNYENLADKRDAAIIDFINETKKNNEKTQYYTLGALLIPLFVLLPLLFTNIGKRNGSNKKAINHTLREFRSLKDNKDIPTIDTCKSISNELREFLTTQVNYSRATEEEIKAAGFPQPAKKFLLFGEPGTGKTFFGKIFAKTLGADYMEIKYSDLNSIYVGEHLDNMRAEFENILSLAKAQPDKKFVVIFNEIDAIVQPAHALIGSRGGHGAFKIEERSIFLNYIDEIAEKAPNVTIIGTTNITPQKSSLDSAAMSRFKNLINVDYPDEKCLKEAIISGMNNNIGINEDFINKNDAAIRKMASQMVKRKCSYRDLDYIIDQSKNYYLSDYMKDKNAKFKFEYIEKALKDHGITDGEIAGIA